MVGRSADENQATGRGDGASAAAVARVLFAFGQRFGNSESGLPRDFAGVSVPGGQPSPGRFLARPVADHFTARVLPRSAESRVRSGTLNAGAVILLRRAFGTAPVVSAVLFLFDPAHQRHVMGLHENVTALWIDRCAAPVRAARAAGELNRAFRRRAVFVVEPRRER